MAQSVLIPAEARFVSSPQRPDRLWGPRDLPTSGYLGVRQQVDDPTCERCLQEDESATYILCDCETIAYLRFRHLGQFFMEPSDF
jgi:hypothetical protein